MLDKHAVLFGVLGGLILLFFATTFYPGGIENDVHTIGFSWRHNYLCNLFNSKAINGSDNPSRYWVISAMLLLSITFALFFYNFSKKISPVKAAGIIKIFGAVAMFFGFLIVTTLHDLMITLSSSCALISLIYISVYIFKSKLQLLKIWTVVCMLILVACNYIYYSGNYPIILPVMQKLVLLFTIIWIVWVEYLTTAKDFQPDKRK